jgi:hypothetical protein
MVAQPVLEVRLGVNPDYSHGTIKEILASIAVPAFPEC